MFYVRHIGKGNSVEVVDTKDWVFERYTKEELLSFNIDIMGVDRLAGVVREATTEAIDVSAKRLQFIGLYPQRLLYHIRYNPTSKDYIFSLLKPIPSANEVGMHDVIQIPSGVETIGGNCFYSSELVHKVVLPSSVTSVMGYAFFNSTLREINLGGRLEKLGDFVFDSSDLKKIKLPESLKFIGAGCFENCVSLKHIEIPSKVKKLPESCFESSGLESIVLNSGLRSIGNKCFKDCNHLKEIRLPKTIKRLGQDCLYCKNLQTIYLDVDNENILTYLWYSCRFESLQYVITPSATYNGRLERIG